MGRDLEYWKKLRQVQIVDSASQSFNVVNSVRVFSDSAATNSISNE